jgi:hypothetical protein
VGVWLVIEQQLNDIEAVIEAVVEADIQALRLPHDPVLSLSLLSTKRGDRGTDQRVKGTNSYPKTAMRAM